MPGINASAFGLIQIQCRREIGVIAKLTQPGLRVHHIAIRLPR